MSQHDDFPQLGKDQGRPTQVRWLIFVLACAVSWILYLHRYSWGIIKPDLQAEYPELDDSQIGWVNSAFLVTYALGQVPSGFAGDRWGPRAILSSIILVWSAAVAGLAFASGLPQLVGTWAFFGLAQAGAYPNLSKVTRSWFPLAVRTTVQGIVASLSGRAGGACAPLLIAALLIGSMGLSWRRALVVIAALGGGLGLAFWFLFRNRPQDHPWANRAECEEIDGPTGSPAQAASGELGPPRLSLKGAGLFALTMMCIYAFASTFVDQLFVYWVPSFLVQGKGLSSAEMGVFASFPLIGGALGGATGGFLNDLLIRGTGKRRWSRSSVAFAGKLLAAVLLVIAIGVNDGRLVALVLLACKFFGDWSLSTLWGTITDVSGRAAGTVFGIVNTAGAVGGFMANPLIGRLLRDGYGWEVVFSLLAGVFALSAVCWLFIDCTQRLEVEPVRTQEEVGQEEALRRFEPPGTEPSEAIKRSKRDIKPG